MSVDTQAHEPSPTDISVAYNTTTLQFGELKLTKGRRDLHPLAIFQFINAASLDTSIIYVFDIKSQHWSALKTGMHAYARWSRDSRSIYFLRWASDPAILRILATGGEAKVVASLKGFPFTGTAGLWLDPSDAPLMLPDESTTDVYALTLEEK